MSKVLTHNQKFESPQKALVHYGVKGMRWGVTTADKSGGRATPSKPKEVNEKKASRLDNRADEAQKAIDTILAKPKPRTQYVQDWRNNEVATLSQIRDKAKRDARQTREGQLTDGQKKAIRNAAVVGGLLVAYGAYKYVDSGTFQQHKTNALQGDKFSWKKNESLASKNETVDGLMANVVTPINRGYGDIGTKMNCRRCTFAYEMRRRGLDVKATKSASGAGQTAAGVLNATTPGAKYKTGRFGIIYELAKEEIKDIDDGPLATALKKGIGETTVASQNFFASNTPAVKSAAIFQSLSKHPNGARGELGMIWTMGGGHSMAWEIVNNKPVIFDTQSGKRWINSTEFQTMAQNMGAAAHTRLDNLTLNEEFLKRWVQNND